MKYSVGKNWFFPELGRKPELGEEISIPGDLTEEQAQKYFNEPGLLAPVRQKAVGHPKKEIRSAEKKTVQKKTSGKPKKSSRKKK